MNNFGNCFLNEVFDSKRVFLNEKFDLENKDIIFTLSGFGAETIGKNVSEIINFGNENNINVVTFDKRGAEGSEFSVSGTVDDILRNMEKYSDKDSNIIFIGNSLLFPCFAKSYLELSGETKNQVGKILALSPVSDMILALQNSINLAIGKGSKIEINSQNIKKYLEMIGKLRNVNMDLEKTSDEIFAYNSDFLKKFHSEAGKKTTYFINPKDKIISPENFYFDSSVKIKEIGTLPGDDTFHNIESSEYLPYIK